MAVLVKLTREDGTALYVRPETVVSVEEFDQGAILTLHSTGGHWEERVSNPADVVAQTLAEYAAAAR